VSQHHVKSCGVIVFRRKPGISFLLMRHPDRWDLPKGHVDRGETELACALRELEEETAITPQDITLEKRFRFTTHYTVRGSRKFGQEPFDKTLILFLGWLTRDVTIRGTEHPSYQWFNWDPPHRIQPQTIDPLLAEVAKYFEAGEAVG